MNEKLKSRKLWVVIMANVYAVAAYIAVCMGVEGIPIKEAIGGATFANTAYLGMQGWIDKGEK